MLNYNELFQKMTADHDQPIQPHGWQTNLANQNGCNDRIIKIPTGFGKTLGVLGAWLWNRIYRQDGSWPRRLIWCLPMRVLVEQTEHESRNALKSIGKFWDGVSNHQEMVGVHVLMGGVDSGDWHLYPEHCAVLIGTQDMLLSRAMNRGYASPRARWPMEFGLLNQDCLWIMDEVQLMDVGLSTSAQLQAFRNDETLKNPKFPSCHTWWMSATLQQDWINKSPDTLDMANNLAKTEISKENRIGHLWNDVQKPFRLVTVNDVREMAQIITHEHVSLSSRSAGPTLVIVNRVEKAVELYSILKTEKSLENCKTDIRLVHSRFRPAERYSWRKDFLNREACIQETNRIVIATQVIEAGVDFSAGLLITELSPWASLIQRFGRCARWGGIAQVIVVDFFNSFENVAALKIQKEIKPERIQREKENLVKTLQNEALPYSYQEMLASRKALSFITDVSPYHLDNFEEEHSDLLGSLYPFDPRHLLLRRELDELFDTTPDLSGADVDVSRFIRSGDERDIQVFWADIPEKTELSTNLHPSRESLCQVPFLKARDWLCGVETISRKETKLKNGMRAWVWDWLDGKWRWAERRDIYPGQIILVASNCGGYDTNKGWSPGSKQAVSIVPFPVIRGDETADAAQDDESLSIQAWQTIAVHGRETGSRAKQIAATLIPDFTEIFCIAGRWHDSGKSHPVFQNSIVSENRPKRFDIAKAPKNAWLPVNKLYPMTNGGRRAGFRHELASVLSIFAVLQRHSPDHSALLGPWRELLTQAGITLEPEKSSAIEPNILEQEIIALPELQFNLLLYLVCSHHGKLRMTWHRCPSDQAAKEEVPRIRGICDGDLLPPIDLVTKDESFKCLPETRLDLSPSAAGLNPHTGSGWTERVLLLLEKYGPFALAWLESLMRAADQRASKSYVLDERINWEETS